MDPRSSRLAILAAILLAASGAAGAQEPLRFRAREGEKYTYTVKSDLEIKNPGMPMKIRSETVYAFLCESGVSPYEFRVEILNEKVTLEFSIPVAGKIKGSIDTAAEKPSAPSNPLDLGRSVVYGLYTKHRAKVGRPFRLVVDDRGRIERMREVQSLLDAVKEALDGDRAVGALLAAPLKRDLTPEFFRQGLEGIFVFLPEAPVRKGDAWSREFERPLQDRSVLKLRESLTLGETAAGSAGFASEVRLVKPGQEIAPAPDAPFTKIRSATADVYALDTEGALDAATGRPLWAVSILEYSSTQEIENTLEGKVRKASSSFKGEISVEFAPGWPEGK
jgi:hypothetical protein